MRATEYIDLITRKDLPDKDEYSHLEIYDEDGKLEKHYRKARKDYKNAGKLVFSEMDTWKDAGTAKYGTRLKEY